jgi:hypothetical protein
MILSNLYGKAQHSGVMVFFRRFGFSGVLKGVELSFLQYWFYVI